jgi:hypothetical protein
MPSRMVQAQSNDWVREVTMNAWWTRRIAGVFAFPGLE